MIAVKKILFERKYKAGYIYRREVWDGSDYGGKDTEMVACYTPSGDYIGNARQARFLCVKQGLRDLQKTQSDHCVCSIGFHPQQKRWYGWSHRAICGFRIGDKLFVQRFGNDKTPFRQHGRKTIETLAQAKLAAKRFAEYVS